MSSQNFRGRGGQGGRGWDAVKVAAVRAAATSPVPGPQATAFAPSAGTKSRTWSVSAALTEPVPSVGRR